jgi:cytochrome c oxidase assembly factor CtaG
VTALLPPTWHPALAAMLGVAAIAYASVTSRPAFRATTGERVRLVAALAVLWVACGWPLGDLAGHVSLTATVLQRLLVMLAAAPLLVTAVPVAVGVWCTRPPILDRLSHALSHPAVAIVVVTSVGTATLVPAVVTWGASSSAAGAAVVAVTLLVGVVLWLPVLGRAPGAWRLSYVAKGAYCMAASLVVTSLSFVWIFSRHVLYPSFSHQHAIVAMSPIVDQQLAGYVAKFGAYLPLWTVAFVLFAKSGEIGEGDGTTLRWVDVQRELERVDRRVRRADGTEVPDRPPG